MDELRNMRASESAGESRSGRGDILSAEGDPAPFDEEPQLGRGARIGVAIALAALALVSFFALGPLFSSPEFHKGTIDRLDDQRNAVVGLMTVSTSASVAITAVPDDIGTPIAEKLMDVTGDFTIILTAIYLEKYALALTGILAFRILVPLALVGCAVLALRGRRDDFAKRGGMLALKVAVFGIALCCVVPASVMVSDIINDTYGISVAADAEQVQAASGNTNTNANTNADANANANSNANSNAGSDSSSDGGFDLLGALQGLVNSASNGLTSVVTDAQNMVNDLLEKFAVLVITSCVMPLLVIAFCVWLVNFVFNLNVSLPAGKMRGAVRGGARKLGR